MVSRKISLIGHYDVVYSPDDAAESGKGYYATLLHDDWRKEKTSPLFKTVEKAYAWAKRHGGVTGHYDHAKVA